MLKRLLLLLLLSGLLSAGVTALTTYQLEIRSNNGSYNKECHDYYLSLFGIDVYSKETSCVIEGHEHTWGYPFAARHLATCSGCNPMGRPPSSNEPSLNWNGVEGNFIIAFLIIFIFGGSVIVVKRQLVKGKTSSLPHEETPPL
jgi:hypothetical protein